MTLYDGLKQKGRPFEIPNAGRNDLPNLFKKLKFQVGAEIGIYKGDFSKILAAPGYKLYAIDPWKIYPGFENARGQKRVDFLYEHTQRALTPFKNIEIIRKTSMEAATDFPDNSLDFVYIDGNHEFRYIAEDLYEWTKRVRPGGIVSGHDYFFNKSDTGKQIWHVAHVLKAYIASFGISDYYLIGSKDAKDGEIRDRWRSWMFVKPA